MALMPREALQAYWPSLIPVLAGARCRRRVSSTKSYRQPFVSAEKSCNIAVRQQSGSSIS